MTKEDRNLLIQDLSTRLLYNVKCQVHDKDYVLSGITSKLCNELYFEELDFKECDGYVSIEYCKPYLFPLSNMTEKQKKELFELCSFCIEEDWEGKKREVYAIEISSSRADPAYCFDHNFYMWGIDIRAIDWINKNHFDYRGLIEKGLAIDCTNLDIY